MVLYFFPAFQGGFSNFFRIPGHFMGEYTVFQGESSDYKRGFGRLRQLNILSKNREKRENGCLFGRRSSMGCRNHLGGALGGRVAQHLRSLELCSERASDALGKTFLYRPWTRLFSERTFFTKTRIFGL